MSLFYTLIQGVMIKGKHTHTSWFAKVFLLFIILTPACAQKPVLLLGEFTEYVDKFEADAKSVGSNAEVYNLQVMKRPLDQDRIAVCTYGDGITPTITVDPMLWESLSPVEKQAAFHHELGHCVLHRSHRDEFTEDGIPLSIMNSHAIQGVILEAFSEYYLKELYLGAEKVTEVPVFQGNFFLGYSK
jgi:hypothetical protein